MPMPNETFLKIKDGQPIYRNKYHKDRLTRRTIDELIGVCKGIQADDIVDVKEAYFLAQWLESNKKVINTYPVNILAKRIGEIFNDDIVDEDEKKGLFETLYQITGFKPQKEIIDIKTGEVLDNLTHASSLLPLDNPPPPIIFENKNFCLTGQFFYGTRDKCMNEITYRGGIIHQKTTQKTDYLIIGLLGSTDWLHSAYGTKIENAVKIKKKKFPIKIVSEEHWGKFL